MRGVELLRCFNRQQPALSIPEVAEQTGLNRTTAYRFLYTLRQLGLLDYDAETRRYSLSLGVLQLGFRIPEQPAARGTRDPSAARFTRRSGQINSPGSARWCERGVSGARARRSHHQRDRERWSTTASYVYVDGPRITRAARELSAALGAPRVPTAA